MYYRAPDVVCTAWVARWVLRNALFEGGSVAILRFRMPFSKPGSGTAVPPSAPLGADFSTFNQPSTLNLSAGLTWKLQIFIFLIAAAAIVSRRPDAILNPQFFGEDGPVWFGQAYSFGWFSSLLHSQNGYFQTLPRLAAAIALLVPLRFAPLVMNLIGITFQVLPVTVLLSSRCAKWAPLSVRGFMAVLYIALPNSMELNVTVEEGQWHLALLACMLVLSEVPRGFWWRIFDVCILALSGVSGPFCLMLLPVAIIFWWLRRALWRLVPIAILVGTSAIQLSAIIQNSAATRPKVGLGATPELFVRLLGGQVYLGALLGQHSAPAHRNLIALAVLMVLCSALIAYCFIKARLEIRLFILFAALVFVASLKSPMVSLTVPQWQVLRDASGIRYFFFPMLAFVWVLVWSAKVSGLKGARIAGAVGIACMIIGIARDWEYPPYTDFHFQQLAKEFDNAPPGTFMSIPIYPPGWALRLTKKNGACSTMPVGFIDTPLPGSHVSGRVPVTGWVSAAQPVTQVSIYVDRKLVGTAKPAISRPDVNQTYPHSPVKDKGWSTIIDLSGVTTGKHQIEARALGSGACAADIAAVPVQYVP